MNPIRLRHTDMVLAEDQPEYLNLPVQVNYTKHGRAFLSRWKLSNDERRAIADGADIYLSVLGAQHPPVRPNVGWSPKLRNNFHAGSSLEANTAVVLVDGEPLDYVFEVNSDKGYALQYVVDPDTGSVEADPITREARFRVVRGRVLLLTKGEI